MGHIHKTKWKNIGFDFVEGNRKELLVYCQGFPCTPTKKDELLELQKKGFSVVVPKYFGSWESYGWMNIETSFETIQKTLRKKRFKCFFCGKTVDFKEKEIIILGDSYGTLIARRFPKRKKILFSPLEWNPEIKKELDLLELVFNADLFGSCYTLAPDFFPDLRKEILKQKPTSNETCFNDEKGKHGYSALKNKWFRSWNK